MQHKQIGITERDHSGAVHMKTLFCLFATLLAVVQVAAANAIYDVSIDTSSLEGTNSTLAFDFIDGGSPSNSIVVSHFPTDSSFGASSSIGSVSGTLGSTATLTDGSFFNELQQPVTLGTSLSFRLLASANAPLYGSLPDTFSFFILNPTATESLVTTTDPTGANSLFAVQIGATGNAVGVYGALAPSLLPVRVSPVPEPSTTMFLLFGIAAIWAIRMRKR